QCRDRRVSEDSRPQWHRRELLDGALAHLGVARANALQARTLHGAEADAAHARSLAAYSDFLTLWKDADPDIPVQEKPKRSTQSCTESGASQKLHRADLPEVARLLGDGGIRETEIEMLIADAGDPLPIEHRGSSGRKR
ncbi:MAG: hypothetical protein JOZ14_08735, partial [Acidobacteria bacterium]|nr:hypothetical protein [Acidobacteriota bacterium]